MKRIEDIEVLRALAISMVLVAHSTVLGWHHRVFGDFGKILSLGAGVDLFFAISGFVIVRSLLPAKHFNEFAIRFWIRRAYRILPAAWLWLAIGILATAFFNSTGVFGTLQVNAADAIAALFQVQNIHYGLCTGATGQPCAPGGVPFGIYWSLSLEEQFYLVLPFVFLLPRRLMIAGLICGVIFQTFAARTPMGVQLRTDALMLGALIALWQGHRTYVAAQPRFLRHPAAKAIALCTLVAALCVSVRTTAALAAALVFIASYNANYIAVGPLRKMALWIGTRSYSLYLCHLIAFCAAREGWFRLTGQETGTLHPSFVASVLAILLISAELTYRFIEVPMRARGRDVASQVRGGALVHT